MSEAAPIGPAPGVIGTPGTPGTPGAMDTIDAAALLHLLQLNSPALPIGGFSYSQGLETAIDQALVSDVATARAWLVRTLHELVARFEAPVFWRLMQAWSRADASAVAHWNAVFLAGRDTAELRAETVQMGFSLARLASALAVADPASQAMLEALPEVALPTALAFAATSMRLPAESALLGMLFSWAENQVIVCVKSVPLGQVAGQQLLLSLRGELETAAMTARTLHDDELCNWAPGLSLLSMRHEVQYSRLYRS